jgi:type II secretion system protein G
VPLPIPRSHAFTLIELLIVVAIIAILAAIALPNFLEAQTRAKVSRVRADMRSVATALEAYRVDNNYYPRAIIGQYPAIPAGQFNRNLAALTTPVAFMTALPADIFNDGYEPGSNPWSQPGRGVNTFDYNTYLRDVGEGGMSPDSWRKSFGESAWKMVSPGPDRGFVNDSSEFGYRDRYDPTNGTISGGDLVRSQAITE